MSETTINTTHRTLTLIVPDYVRDAESFAAWTQDEANKAIAALGRAVLRHSTANPTDRPAEPAGTLGEKAVLLIASEIGDAIVAHDAGERVNAIVRARHVLAALPAVPAPSSGVTQEEAETLWRWLYAMTLTAASLRLSLRPPRQRW